MAPARGPAQDPTPKRPEVCATSWPGCQAPSSRQAVHQLPAAHHPGRRAAPVRRVPRCPGSPGSARRAAGVSARSRLASDTAETPTTACPTPRSAAPRTAPTLPAPMTPMPRRPGLGMLPWPSCPVGVRSGCGRAAVRAPWLPRTGSATGLGRGFGSGFEPAFWKAAAPGAPARAACSSKSRGPSSSADLDSTRGDRPGGGVQHQVRHARIAGPAGPGAAPWTGSAGAAPPRGCATSRPDAGQQGGARGGEAVAAPVQRGRASGPPRRGDKAAVGVPPSF